MTYLLGIVVFLGLLAICWFGYLATERQARALSAAHRRDTTPPTTAAPTRPQPAAAPVQSTIPPSSPRGEAL